MPTNPFRSARPPRPRRCVYVTAATLFACVSGLAAAPTPETIQIGASPDGLPIEIIALGDPNPDRQGLRRDQRPALLIVAGLQAHHEIGRVTARALAERLLADHAELLTDRTIYILSNANPEGAARWSNRGLYRAETGRAPQLMDADRDGRFDEDPPNDLNGDGLITMMRVPAPTPQTIRYNLRPTHIIDPDDPRLMREPKPAEGETATHAILIEGLDSDNDGSFNEDGWGGASGGGIDLDRHFPIHWPEHTDGAGLYPLERPEARSIVEWAQDRHNIVAVLVYGPHDTLGTVPPAGRFPPPGRVPSGIEEGDKPWHDKVSEFYKEVTGVTGAGESPSRDGSFLQWAYADLGVFTFGTPVWTRPDLVKADATPGADRDEARETPAADQPDPRQAEADALAARGVPPDIVAFITMTPGERAAEIASFEQMSEEEGRAMMAAVMALPDDIRARVMTLAQGGDDPGPMAAAPAGERPAPARPARSRSNAGSSPDAKWLEWIDREGVDGFVSWEPFDHPQLGPVEIGGFVPGVRVNPPRDMVPGLIDQQTAFVAGLLERMPALEIDPPTVERVGPSLWRISMSARNHGLLPTVAAIGQKARRLHPLIFALDPDVTIPPNRLVGGSRLARFEVVEGSGASVHASWLVIAEEGDEIRIDVRAAQFGNRGFDVRLSENTNGGGR
ncbi:MAG: hypothetical protein LAT64_09060 [Phycisphaerales bacterium]|nr:hypothetical protein [Planctomycetota bacterium]MCH8508898.1 hypothetical protein [Phycisphaerales bacterium]